MAWSFVIFSCFLSFVLAKYDNDWELKMANVLYRHGDRSPVATFPKDEHRDYWKQGLGQLTEIGKKQEFSMGQFLKLRYVNKLLNPTYLRKQVYCRSSDKDRCLMSAEAQMAGLYPPRNYTFKNESHAREWQFWQLIPIHTVPKDHDKLLRPYDYNCPRLQEIKKESMSDPQYIEMGKKYEAFMQNVSCNLGLKPGHFLNLSTIYKAYDLFFCQRAHNLRWPKWVTADVFEKLTQLQYFDFVWMFGTPEKCRLTGGTLLGEMIQNMEKFKNNPKNSRKLYVYSAHDTTVVGLLSALKIYSGTPPPYSTAFLMELYFNKKTSKYSVRMFYRNDTSQPKYAYQLAIPGCKDCSLEKFANLTFSAVPVDYDKECEVKQSSCEKPHHSSCKGIKDTLTAVVIILLLVFIALVGIIVRRCQKKRKTRSLAHFTQIQNEEWDSD